MKNWPALIFAVMLCLFFAGCDTDDGTEPPPRGETEEETPFTGLTSIDDVNIYLYSAQGGQSPDDPVELSVKISASEWVQLFSVIVSSDKFFTLDISRCYDVPQEFVREFRNNEKIVSIALPVGITSIRGSNFYFCTNLKQVILPTGITLIGSSTFSGCTNLEQITLPTSLTRIGDAAFRDCTSLTEIDLPASLTRIGMGAFYSCASLTRVICRATTPPTIDEPFYNTPANLNIQVPPASVAAYKAAWSDYADIITGY